MAVALLTSLVLALSFTPVLAERFVKVKRRDQKHLPDNELSPQALSADSELRAQEHEVEEETGRVLGAIIRRYEWVLDHALSNRWLVVVVCALVLVGSYLLYRNLGSDFLPAFDEGAFILDYTAPPGTSLAETDRMLQHIEQMLKDTPEVESYSRRTGLQLGLFITEPNTGDFLAKLKPGHARTTEEVKDDLRKEIASKEPGLSR